MLFYMDSPNIHVSSETEQIKQRVIEQTGGVDFDLFDDKAVDAAIKRGFDVELDCEHYPQFLTGYARFNRTAADIVRYRSIISRQNESRSRSQDIADRVMQQFNEKIARYNGG